MADPISIETVRAGQLRDAGHLNYGKLGGGTIWQHTTIRRLKAIDRPALTESEAEVLSHVPADWVRLHDFRTALATTLGRQVGIDLMLCGDKGFTETDMRPGKERREPWIRRKTEAQS